MKCVQVSVPEGYYLLKVMEQTSVKRIPQINILLVGLLLAACAGQIDATFPDAEIELQQTAAEGTASNETDETVQTPEDSSLESESAARISVSGSDVLPVIVLGDPDFHSSDPGTVTLAAGKVQMVEFFAYWCAVCKAMAPTVHGLENMYGDQINFVYLDREDPATLVFQDQLGYVYQPHFFLLDQDGSILAQWRGYVDGVELQRALVGAVEN